MYIGLVFIVTPAPLKISKMLSKPLYLIRSVSVVNFTLFLGFVSSDA